MEKFTFTTTRNGDKLTVNAAGRIDTSNAQQFENEVKESLEGITELTLGVDNVEYISSSGLRSLLILHKLMSAKDGKLIVRNPAEMVCEVFEATGFMDVLNIEG